MAEVKRLFAQRSLVEAKVKRLQEQLVDRDGTNRPSFARVKLYGSELQFLYREYQRVYGELLSAFPAERYADLDENYERFEDLHFDACLLVETLLLSFPTTGNKYQHSRALSYNYFAATTAPRWRIPIIRSRSPNPPTEQSVPIPDVMEKPNTSPPKELSPEQLFPAQANELKVSQFAINPIHSLQPPSAETSAMKLNPVCGAALVRSEGDLAEVIKSKSAPMPIVPPSVAPIAQKCHREEDSTHSGKMPTTCEEVTTVAYEDEPNPPCKQSEYSANPAKTNPEEFHVGNASTQFVNNVNNIPSCEVTNPIPINLVGIHPKLTSFQRTTGCGALPKSFLMPPGFHPPPRLALMPTDVPKILQNPAASSQSFQCATSSRPVLQRFPCVSGFRTIPIKFPSVIGLCPVAKRFPCRTRFRPAIPSRLAGFHPTPQRFPCVAGSIPALKHSSNLTESNSVVKPFQRVFPDVAGFPLVMKQPSSVNGYQPVSQRFPAASVFHLVAKKFQCLASIHLIREQPSCATGPRSVLKQFPPSVGSHPAPEKPPDMTGIPPPVPKPPDVTGIPPVSKLAMSSTEMPARFKPIRMSAGIPPISKPILKMSEICPAKQPCPVPTGIHPVSKWLRCSTTIPPIAMPFLTTAGIHPVKESTPMPTGKRPVLSEAQNQRLTEKMMPPVNPTGGSKQPHTKSRPEKPPDEAPMRRRASEAIPECVSRTHPPKEDVHHVHGATGKQTFDLWCVHYSLSWLKVVSPVHL
ncbi:AAEL014133-PA [Aedes aegypti]|uniref:AAEL014133-PA n=1 Tax=Aedes aegypti TaxID=7159 RepID=Q16H75_AEDAE|nr:AAEL014133-PA [Aedes aegypti]